MKIKLTSEEKKAIRELKNLSKIWPKSLWLFAGDGCFISILKYGKDGQMMNEFGNIDQDYIVDNVKIPNDGGDW